MYCTNFDKFYFTSQENGFIDALYVGSEPVWSTNVKRAIAINFQLKKDSGSYTNEEVILLRIFIIIDYK